MWTQLCCFCSLSGCFPCWKACSPPLVEISWLSVCFIERRACPGWCRPSLRAFAVRHCEASKCTVLSQHPFNFSGNLAFPWEFQDYLVNFLCFFKLIHKLNRDWTDFIELGEETLYLKECSRCQDEAQPLWLKLQVRPSHYQTKRQILVRW